MGAQIPDTEEVRDGIWALPLPMAGPLGYVFAYALALEDGVLLIDAGPDTDEAFEALGNGLRAAGSDLGDVRGVLFTHGHGDHYGSAGRVRESSDAWLAMHEVDARMFGKTRAERAAGFTSLDAWLTDLGVVEPEAEGIRIMLGARWAPKSVDPDRYVEEGDRFRVAGGELVAIHTPGHSPGHVCFVHRDAGVVFTGDHLLSPITPSVAVNRFMPGNPLAEYMEALTKVTGLGDLLGLPGHRVRFSVAQRATEIIAHHESQLGSVAEILSAGPLTVREVAEQMTWASAWSELGPGAVFMAMGETLAHLVVLEQRGVAQRHPTSPVRWVQQRGRRAA
jgi:glyoxylase-like metal-dependent hydrolase (beta-lactamase superfamily II)